ncbi:MAG: hypothetical protein GVY36_02120 [Verrucomicrobia bacterium]|jgi:hypothetical protein|nr:hypothetical protein [Verrucomicrobiota bacterium]
MKIDAWRHRFLILSVALSAAFSCTHALDSGFEGWVQTELASGKKTIILPPVSWKMGERTLVTRLNHYQQMGVDTLYIGDTIGFHDTDTLELLATGKLVNYQDMDVGQEDIFDQCNTGGFSGATFEIHTTPRDNAADTPLHKNVRIYYKEPF